MQQESFPRQSARTRAFTAGAPRLFSVSPDGTTLAVISRLIDSGDIRVFVDQVFDLADAAAAHAALEGGHTRGKIVLRVAD